MRDLIGSDSPSGIVFHGSLSWMLCNVMIIAIGGLFDFGLFDFLFLHHHFN
jgi:hypothetical protein